MLDPLAILSRALIVTLLLFPLSFSQSEPPAVIEIGPALSRNFTGGRTAFGPTIAMEVTPIENWLELEAGVTSLFRRHSTEWVLDLLFKKPWTLSDKKEFMIGAAPTGFTRMLSA